MCLTAVCDNVVNSDKFIKRFANKKNIYDVIFCLVFMNISECIIYNNSCNYIDYTHPLECI